MSISMRPRGAPLARFPAPPVVSSLFTKGTPRTGSDGGYPWHDGELLYAADLNAAITATSASVLDLGAKGDGVTDDTAAIQNALNTYAGKATVVVPDTGQSYIVGALTVPTGTDLLIYGKLMARTNSGTMLYIENASNVTLRGHGTLDGNGANQAGSSIAVVYSYQATNLQISGLTLQNALNWNLNIVASSHVRVDGVSMIGGGNSNEFAQNCTDCWITNSLVDGPSADGGFSFYGGVTNGGAIGNTVRNSGMASNSANSGVYVLSDEFSTAPSSNIVIADNICYNCGGSGISIDTSAAGVHDGIIVSNNLCHDNGKATNEPIVADLFVNHCNNATFIGNQSSRFGGSPSIQYYGMYAGANAYGAGFIGNLIFAVGQGGTTGGGLYVAGSTFLTASGNVIYDSQQPPTMASAIDGTAGADNAYVGNYSNLPNTLAAVRDTYSANAVAGFSWMVGTGANETGAAMGINAAPGFNGMLQYQSASHPVWFVGTDGGAQSGGNTGANYDIIAGNDDGTTVLALSISRATKQLRITTPPPFANDAAAAAGNVPVGGLYRVGSALQVRVI